jgi:NTP pyrophosphatase (non-canonical NTP hydrolase)
MSLSMYGQVIAWDEATGGAPIELRVKCMREEMLELLDALDEGSRAKIAKECADVVWTILALCHGYGLPFELVWEAVEQSNWRKIGPGGEVVRREDGKIIKPPGWEPPDVAGILEATT